MILIKVLQFLLIWISRRPSPEPCRTLSTPYALASLILGFLLMSNVVRRGAAYVQALQSTAAAGDAICLTCVVGILIGLQMDSRIGLTLKRLRYIHADRVICF